MNVTILIIEALAFASLFTVAVFVMARNKESAAYIHNCPSASGLD